MTLGVAVLGTGRVVETGYIPALREIGEVKLVAILSRAQARAERFAREHNIPNAYSDIDSLLRDPAVDAVIVATPDATHEPQVIAAARAGKHILCEKPMTTTVESCRPMVEAVRSSGVTFAMGYDNRFNAGLDTIKKMINAGEIGTVRYAHAHFTTTVSDPTNWRAAGEQSRFWAMSTSGTHILDIYRWYFGDPVRTGGAFTAPVHGEKDEIAVMVLDYPGRMIADFVVGAILPEMNRIELHGDKGSIFGEKVFGRRNAKALITCKGKQYVVDQTNPFIHEIRDFLEAIRDNRPPRTSLEDGVRNIEIMEIAWKAKSLQPIVPLV
jgi:1,5-anhydro-D-fructose reductase (1,5-anhydro-D-mannitol-forming)